MTTYDFIEKLANILEVYNDGYEMMPSEQIAIEDALEHWSRQLIKRDREELLKSFSSHENQQIATIMYSKDIPNIKNG